MKTSRKLTNLIDGNECYFEYEEISNCPVCKAKISPKYINSVLYALKNNNKRITVLDFCAGCHSMFITEYEVSPSGSYSYSPIKIVSSEPNRFIAKTFDDNIKTLSPTFVEIYNQALQAESMNLNQIAGIGYRKALEFLTKDFAISEHPDKTEPIQNMMLSKCITNYIDDIRIKTLATKSAWLGNDETHYIRKHVENDVNDMKSFIEAMVYFISMVLIIKEADTIEKK